MGMKPLYSACWGRMFFIVGERGFYIVKSMNLIDEGKLKNQYACLICLYQGHFCTVK